MKGLFESIQAMEVDTIDSVDIAEESLSSILNVLSMIINNALDIKITSVGLRDKTIAFERKVNKNVTPNKQGDKD